MKTRVISMLVMLVAFLSSCEENLQVAGPKIPDADKTVTVILSNIPAGFTGGKVYLLTLNSDGKVYSIEEAEASEGTEVQIAPVPGFSTFDVVALIPTVNNWSTKSPFTAGHYSRATALQDRDGVFVTKTWTSSTTLAGSPTTGLKSTVQADLSVNGSTTPSDTEFTKGEIVTLDATVTDNINSPVTSVAYLLDGTELKSYTTKPYKFQWNTVAVETGTHWLYVKAKNEAGHEALDSIKIFVAAVAGNQGPTIAFTNIANGNQYDRQTVLNVTASATDPDDGIDKVELRVNGVLLGTDNTSPFSFTWDTYNNSAGAVVLELTAYDKAGQARTDVVNVTLKTPTNFIPRVTITGPANNANFAVGVATIDLAATATDAENDPINRVEFYYRKSTASVDTFIGQDTTSPYTFAWSTAALTAGTYYIFAVVYDNTGRSTYTSTTITIQ